MKPVTRRLEDGRWGVFYDQALVWSFVARTSAWRFANRIRDWQERSGGR